MPRPLFWQLCLFLARLPNLCYPEHDFRRSDVVRSIGQPTPDTHPHLMQPLEGLILVYLTRIFNVCLKLDATQYLRLSLICPLKRVSFDRVPVACNSRGTVV